MFNKRVWLNPISSSSTSSIVCYSGKFLSWFENRCKNDMSQEEWDNLKSNIEEYFI